MDCFDSFDGTGSIWVVDDLVAWERKLERLCLDRRIDLAAEAVMTTVIWTQTSVILMLMALTTQILLSIVRGLAWLSVYLPC